MPKKTKATSSKNSPPAADAGTAAAPYGRHADGWPWPAPPVAIDTLTPDPRNARLHSERNLKSIAASLKRYGQVKPIVVDADGVVLAGNGTMTAAQSLGWTEIAVTRTHLRGSEARAYAIADNRTAELAEWDVDELSATLSELDAEGLDVGDLEITDAELSALVDGDFAAAHAFAPKREKPAKEPGVEAVDPLFKVIVTCADEKQQAAIIVFLESISANYKAPSV